MIDGANFLNTMLSEDAKKNQKITATAYFTHLIGIAAVLYMEPN
jgi:hypothetical protein